jgi:hypothetical protein
MYTGIVHFKLRPGITRAEAIADIRHTIPIYQAQPALVRKQIMLDLEAGEGRSVYLWKDRASAETFYEMARPMLVKQTGAEPKIEILETQVIVDNSTGDVMVAE